MIDSGQNTGRHPYTNFYCRTCTAVIRGPVSYGVQALRMHEDKCKTATPAEREAWRFTKRWPRKVS